MNKIEVHLEEYQKGSEYIKSNPRILLWVISTISAKVLSRLSIAFVIYKAFGLSSYNFLDILCTANNAGTRSGISAIARGCRRNGNRFFSGKIKQYSVPINYYPPC